MNKLEIQEEMEKIDQGMDGIAKAYEELWGLLLNVVRDLSKEETES